jgi:hypothetical protein
MARYENQVFWKTKAWLERDLWATVEDKFGSRLWLAGARKLPDGQVFCVYEESRTLYWFRTNNNDTCIAIAKGKNKNREKKKKGRRTEISYDVTGINGSKLFANVARYHILLQSTVLGYIINLSERRRHVVVSLAGGRWPQSPSARNTTRPDGRMAIHVTLALWRLIRSHASGGNCKALKITNILRMKTSTSQKPILSDSSDLQTKKRITLAWQTKIS